MQAPDADIRPRQRRATEGSARDQRSLQDTDSRSRDAGAIGSQQSHPAQLADELAELCSFRTAGSGRGIRISNPDSLAQERSAAASQVQAQLFASHDVDEYAVLGRQKLCCKGRLPAPQSQHSCRWERTGLSCRL